MGCLRWSQFDEYLNRSLSAQIAFLQVAPSAATLDDMGVGASSSGGRQDRRKAATRAKILAAAEELFDDRGYADTSIEDISESADVAVRTIYMHFPTKAAIMLAYFDRWVDAFSLEVQHRPVSEPVVELSLIHI